MELTHSQSLGAVAYTPAGARNGLALGRRNSTVLESLLMHTARPPASHGFGLTSDWFGGGCAPPAKVQRCSSAPLPSSSSPLGFHNDHDYDRHDMSPPPVITTGGGRVCRGCNNPAAATTTGHDGCVSCDGCGAVLEDRALIALGHDKQIRSDEDSTTRADTWEAKAPDPADLESAVDAMARHGREVGGTPLHYGKTRKLGVASAASAIKRSAVAAYRRQIQWSSKLEARHRLTLVVLTEVLETVSGVHDRVHEVCRRALRTLLEENEKHTTTCHCTECDVTIDQIPNALLASTVVRVAIEGLQRTHGTFEWPLDGVDVTRASLLKIVDQAGRACGRASSLQVATARVAVERLLSDEPVPASCEKLLPAPAEEEEADAVTLPLAVVPLAGTEKNLSNESLVDAAPDQCIFALRNALWAVTQLTNTANIRELAFDLIAIPAVTDWARGVELSADTAACCLALAIAHKTDRDVGPLDATLKRVASSTSSSMHVAQDQISKLLLILPESILPEQAEAQADSNNHNDSAETLL
jgi:hypothetical protein